MQIEVISKSKILEYIEQYTDNKAKRNILKLRYLDGVTWDELGIHRLDFRKKQKIREFEKFVVEMEKQI